MYKDKLSYHAKKYRNMRMAKSLKPLTQRQIEMREEEAFRLGLSRKNIGTKNTHHERYT